MGPELQTVTAPALKPGLEFSRVGGGWQRSSLPVCYCLSCVLEKHAGKTWLSQSPLTALLRLHFIDFP